jgi:hypothetical protein
VSFAAITLGVAPQRVFIVVSSYYSVDSVRKLLDTLPIIQRLSAGTTKYMGNYTKRKGHDGISASCLGLLGCDAVWCCGRIPTFQCSMLKMESSMVRHIQMKPGNFCKLFGELKLAMVTMTHEEKYVTQYA